MAFFRQTRNVLLVRKHILVRYTTNIYTHYIPVLSPVNHDFAMVALWEFHTTMKNYPYRLSGGERKCRLQLVRLLEANNYSYIWVSRKT